MTRETLTSWWVVTLKLVAILGSYGTKSICICVIARITFLMVCPASLPTLPMVSFNLSIFFVDCWFAESAKLAQTLHADPARIRIHAPLGQYEYQIINLPKTRFKYIIHACTYRASKVKRRTSKNTVKQWWSKKSLIAQLLMLGCFKVMKIPNPNPHSNHTPAIAYPCTPVNAVDWISGKKKKKHTKSIHQVPQC